MSKITDIPPVANSTAPSIPHRVTRSLERIGHYKGAPYFRIVWGQDRYRFWNGDRMRYLDHTEKTKAWGLPKYGVDGRFAGWADIFYPGDVMPPDGILHQVVDEQDIGIPRFFIELVTEVGSPEAWEFERYKNERGQTVLGPDGNAIDWLGPYPENGLDYEMVWICARHDGCCDEVSRASNFGIKDLSKRCYGHYRLPTEDDVREMQSRFNRAMQELHELKPEGDELQAAMKTRQYFKDIEEMEQQDEARAEDMVYQALLPASKRLTAEGHGLDLHKYVDLGQRPAFKESECQHTE